MCIIKENVKLRLAATLCLAPVEHFFFFFFKAIHRQTRQNMQINYGGVPLLLIPQCLSQLDVQMDCG